jgi:hypothetical protein
VELFITEITFFAIVFKISLDQGWGSIKDPINYSYTKVGEEIWPLVFVAPLLVSIPVLTTCICFLINKKRKFDKYKCASILIILNSVSIIMCIFCLNGYS